MCRFGRCRVRPGQPIDTIEKALKVRILTENDAPTPQDVVGQLSTEDAVPPIPAAALLERAGTSDGRRALATLYLRHADEVRALIQGNPRVAAVWVRARGPQLLVELTRVPRAPERTIPGYDVEQAAERLDRIAAALARFGSPGLRADLARFRPVINRLAQGDW